MTYHLRKTGKWNLHLMVWFQCFKMCKQCDIWGSHGSVAQDSNFLEYYTVLLDKHFLTTQRQYDAQDYMDI